MNAREKYLQKVKEAKTTMKVFLVNGTMLQGLVVDYDDVSVVIDKCLVNYRNIISMTPIK